MTYAENCQPEFRRITFESLDLVVRNRVSYRLVLTGSRDIMIRRTYCSLRSENTQTSVPEPVKRLRTCHLMTIMAVYVQLSGAAGYIRHRMRVPYLVK